MNRTVASALSLAASAAAIACAAAIASGNAYAETPTIDNTPFVSIRTRAEVQAELMSQPELLRATEWSMQYNQVPRARSAYTSEQAKSQYKASRDEVRALTSEDGGSSYFARQPVRMNTSTMGASSTDEILAIDP